MLDPARLAALVRERPAAAVVTVTATKGSTPRKAGTSMLVFDDGTDLGAIEGTIGGGAVEHEVRRRARDCIALTRPASFTLSLTTELGMCCGGQMTFFVEPVRQRPPCLVLGAGHVGRALAAAANAAGFDVTVADPRPDQLTVERFPDCALVADYEDEDLDRMPFGPDAFVVVVTHDHAVDQRLVERCLPRPRRYLAMIGSVRKATLMRERCRAKGFSDDDVARVLSPAGLDIGAETPEEIAISIVAQMIEVRRREPLADTVVAAPAKIAG